MTPPSQAFSLDNSASPAANSSVEDIRVWAMGMFRHHEKIVKRIVEKQNADRQGVEGDVSALSARMEVIEVVVRNVNTAAVAADTKLREEIAEFSTKLAASEDADGAAGLQHQSAGRSATASVWLARHVFSRSASAASLSASIPAASNPALLAPASPIASVPTGMPAGI